MSPTATATRLHWLVGIAVRSGLQGAESLELDDRTPAKEAWEKVAETCGIDTETLAAHVARTTHMGIAILSAIESKALKLIPGSLARKHMICPLFENERQLAVAICDPMDFNAEQAVEFASGRTPVLEIAPPDAIARAIENNYESQDVYDSLVNENGEDLETSVRMIDDSGDEDGEDDTDAAPVIKLVNLIIRDGINQGASDIHLQPGANGGKIRFRVDGVLRVYTQIPLPALQRVISRIKILAKMDISDKRRPQDGKAQISAGNKSYDLRVSTVPTRGAEKCVIRVLDTGGSPAIDDLGVAAPELEKFKRLLLHRDGVVVVTGPTGSGKTTTLYGALQEIEDEDTNIMTVEDPVEYEMPGLTQIQVEPKQGVTFASALRAILRQDPDVIFVGEIRDGETAEIAVQASLTGHVVLATLHTNDAIGAVKRLEDLGLDRASIVETLRGAIAQRLARKICTKCKGKRGSCEACGGSGYRGRFPINEVFVMSPRIESLILQGVAPTELEAAAEEEGMRGLLAVGTEKIEEGITTKEEVERVLGVQITDEMLKVESKVVELGDSLPNAAVVEVAETIRKIEKSNSGSDETHVLVVDDDSVSRTIARASLEKDGFKCTEASGGQQAIDIIQQHALFDLILLDLQMPEVDGRDVLRVVRSSPTTLGVPVIVLTGSNDAESEFEIMDQGADDYMRKPIDPRRLLTRVKAVLRRAAT